MCESTSVVPKGLNIGLCHKRLLPAQGECRRSLTCQAVGFSLKWCEVSLYAPVQIGVLPENKQVGGQVWSIVEL